MRPRVFVCTKLPLSANMAFAAIAAHEFAARLAQCNIHAPSRLGNTDCIVMLIRFSNRSIGRAR